MEKKATLRGFPIVSIPMLVALFFYFMKTPVTFLAITIAVILTAFILGGLLLKKDASWKAVILGWTGTGFFFSTVLITGVHMWKVFSNSTSSSLFDAILPLLMWSIILFVPLGIRTWRNSIQHFQNIRKFAEMKQFTETREAMEESAKKFIEMREAMEEVMENIGLIKGFMETIAGKKNSPQRSEKTENSKK